MIYHWACVDLTSKPPRHWTCSKCSKEKKKKSTSGDHSYSSRLINETVTDDHKAKPTRAKNGSLSTKNHVVTDESEADISEIDHNYGKTERELNGRNRAKSVKLNKLEDLCDMSKGELKDLCYAEDVNSKGTREVLEERLRKHFQKNFKQADKKKMSKLSEITEGETVCIICGLGWELPEPLADHCMVITRSSGIGRRLWVIGGSNKPQRYRVEVHARPLDDPSAPWTRMPDLLDAR